VPLKFKKKTSSPKRFDHADRHGKHRPFSGLRQRFRKGGARFGGWTSISSSVNLQPACVSESRSPMESGAIPIDNSAPEWQSQKSSMSFRELVSVPILCARIELISRCG
jgi:hypothetical protein